ncbi:hypothetical protein J4Q44_G00174380 [Coregonus suidteri]|uniref:Phospholipase B-like n=1 Tax=Coregonus suidteri TaxID=861788 RepID=A0AAN8LL65_9TELE
MDEATSFQDNEAAGQVTALWRRKNCEVVVAVVRSTDKTSSFLLHHSEFKTLQPHKWLVGKLEIRAGYGETLEHDEVTYFLAGYLKGFLTAPQMISHYANMYPQLIKDPKVLGPVEHFMAKQDSWTREQVKLNRSTDPLWHHTGFIVAQMDGLQAGVAHWAKKQGKEPLSLFAVQFLNAVGDLLDLIPALVPGTEPPL